MANYVPLDVLENHIFVRLSVKSALNCSCVCKQWHRILSGSEFKKIHFHQQTKEDHSQRKIICGPLKYRYISKDLKEENNHELRATVSACRGIFYSLDLESSPPKLTRLPGFPVTRMDNFELVRTLGYSNGMLCMEVENTSDRVWRHILFGNPSTGYYKILTLPFVTGYHIVGFGYDSYAEDYKFVRIDNVTRHPHIYSLKSNTWRTNTRSRSDEHKSKLEDRIMRGFISEGSFVDGSIYWFANQSIVRFDLQDEKFYTVPMPRDYHNGYISLKVVQGSLCLIQRVPHRFPHNEVIDVEMWLLKEEKNITEKKYHWTNLLKLSDLFAKYIYPFFIMKDGRVVCCLDHKTEIKEFPSNSQYVLIDPETSRVQKFDISGIHDGILRDFIFGSQFSGYVDTFVSPN